MENKLEFIRKFYPEAKYYYGGSFVYISGDYFIYKKEEYFSVHIGVFNYFYGYETIEDVKRGSFIECLLYISEKLGNTSINKRIRLCVALELF